MAGFNHCEHTKPQVCSKQWNSKGWKFQGLAKNLSKSTIHGLMGAYLRDPKGGWHFYWNKKTSTLAHGKTATSKVVKCPKGWEAQGVWDATPGKAGGNWYSAVTICK
ncbi:hypothetical protein GCM10023196_066380 [Actinoallomurus vinaceus]|uniref:Uncharacterized protein n=1 Tax=Actinoallomurus vinaceus TaxID=1080074 RepID=A0ABP8UHT7_9ACTN